MKHINSPQRLPIPRKNWYDLLQYDISPFFKPDNALSDIATALFRLENTPRAIQFFAENCHNLDDYGYWFLLGVCWVQYTGFSDLTLWKELFSSNRPHRPQCLMKPTELRYYKAFPKEVCAFRVHRAEEKDWISYTLDLDTARKFADIRGVKEIHQYKISKGNILCLFLRRQEYEVLCLNNVKAKLEKVLPVS